LPVATDKAAQPTGVDLGGVADQVTEATGIGLPAEGMATSKFDVGRVQARS
jgi:hypothetical protein